MHWLSTIPSDVWGCWVGCCRGTLQTEGFQTSLNWIGLLGLFAVVDSGIDYGESTNQMVEASQNRCLRRLSPDSTWPSQLLMIAATRHQARFPIMIPDVLLLIAQELQGHPPALSRLCMIDKATYQLLRYILYQRVQLDSATSIHLFCSTINSAVGKSAGGDVISLSIGVMHIFHPSKMLKTFAPDLHAALRLMPNLRDLSLTATSRALTLILNNLHPPFKLRRFSYSGDSSGPVIRFLMNQTLLTTLEMWDKPSNHAFRTLQHTMFRKTTYLAHLEQVLGPIDIAPYLVPMRPVTSIVIVDKNYIDFTQPIEYISESTSPISSICFIKQFYHWHGWRLAIERLKSPSFCATLRKITIQDIFLVWLGFPLKRAALKYA